MAYDEQLAARMRAALDGLQNVSEKRMMGSLCFMLDGNMIGGADRTKSGQGRFLFRVGKENQAAALARPGARPMEMAGRTMNGFVFVDAQACDDTQLKEWIALALAFVRTLPPK